MGESPLMRVKLVLQKSWMLPPWERNWVMLMARGGMLPRHWTTRFDGHLIDRQLLGQLPNTMTSNEQRLVCPLPMAVQVMVVVPGPNEEPEDGVQETKTLVPQKFV